jgi:hypothetical protein
MKMLPLLNLFRRRPTLPHGFPCSTIGADRLNFRVRDGIGWNPIAMATGNLTFPCRNQRQAEHHSIQVTMLSTQLDLA